jgi:hypothetical protein
MSPCVGSLGPSSLSQARIKEERKKCKLATKTRTKEKSDTSVLGEDGVSKNGRGMMPDSESQTCLEAARQI